MSDATDSGSIADDRPAKLDALVTQIAASSSIVATEGQEARAVVYDVAVETQRTENTGRGYYFQLRTEWSRGLFRVLCTMVLFQYSLVVSVGFGWLKFADNRPFLYLVTSENFAQIVGLCIFVVAFLFPSEKSQRETPKLPRFGFGTGKVKESSMGRDKDIE
jgi:hypothetical protein